MSEPGTPSKPRFINEDGTNVRPCLLTPGPGWSHKLRKFTGVRVGDRPGRLAMEFSKLNESLL